MKSQNKEIKKWLETGNSITPIEALNIFGCFRLGARIHDLKNKFGVNIKTEIVESGNKRFAKYSLNLE